jgi:hypothetical protein
MADLEMVGGPDTPKAKWQQYLASAGSQLTKYGLTVKARLQGRWYRVWLGEETPEYIRKAALAFKPVKKRRRNRKYPRLHQPARRDVIAG